MGSQSVYERIFKKEPQIEKAQGNTIFLLLHP
jgi:hypothetical protein